MAVVDDEDYVPLATHRWQLNPKTNMVQRCVRIAGKITTLLMAREIVHVLDGIKVDHWDHNKLNNQKSNLRPCTRSQNGGNRLKQTSPTSSCFKGVYVYKNGRITAQVWVNKTRIHLGDFPSEEKAAEAYDVAAKVYFGQFAKTNF